MCSSEDLRDGILLMTPEMDNAVQQAPQPGRQSMREVPFTRRTNQVAGGGAIIADRAGQD
jgi:hypothetical protein